MQRRAWTCEEVGQTLHRTLAKVYVGGGGYKAVVRLAADRVADVRHMLNGDPRHCFQPFDAADAALPQNVEAEAADANHWQIDFNDDKMEVMGFFLQAKAVREPATPEQLAEARNLRRQLEPAEGGELQAMLAGHNG